jgi:GAF domain-containing protein
LQELADRSAPTLERARLGELERASRARASFLDEAGEVLAGQSDPQKIVALAVRLVVPALADWCAVLLADAGGLPRPVYLSHVDESRADPLAWLLESAPPAETGEGADVPRGGAAMAGRRWQLAVPSGAAPAGGVPPEAAQLAADGAWCFPLAVAGRSLGLLAIGTSAGGRPDAEVTELADGVARRAALALDNASRPPRPRLASRLLRPVRLPSDAPPHDA